MCVYLHVCICVSRAICVCVFMCVCVAGAGVCAADLQLLFHCCLHPGVGDEDGGTGLPAVLPGQVKSRCLPSPSVPYHPGPPCINVPLTWAFWTFWDSCFTFATSDFAPDTFSSHNPNLFIAKFFLISFNTWVSWIFKSTMKKQTFCQSKFIAMNYEWSPLTYSFLICNVKYDPGYK